MRRKKIAFALLLLLALLLLCGCGNKGETALPSPTPVPTPEPDYSGQLRISEFMTKNKAALADESGAFPDWVELECIAASPVDLSGWALSDRPGTAKLPLEARMAQPGDYALLFCGEDSFSLSQGETLYLLSPDGKIQDQALCPESASDRSLQRQADGSFEVLHAKKGDPLLIYRRGSFTLAVNPSDKPVPTGLIGQPIFQIGAFEGGVLGPRSFAVLGA